jgi:nucleotide-binding universal stress UspA family protein
MTHVLIAADDTEVSIEAARTARELFGDAAHYTVISVADTSGFMWAGSAMAWGVPYPMTIPAAGVAGPPLVFQQPTDTEHRPIDVAERHADEVAVAADLPHADAMGEVGDPAHTIVRAAAACGADVIVVGSHDRSWFSRLFSPSVAAAVVSESSVPVLVVR